MQTDALILRAAKGLKVERTPVWVMRQAGRILPEYRAIRASLSGFKELVETPALAAEVSKQPVDILGVDAAIIFSDILVVPEAMGLPYQMIEQKGPWFEKTIETHADILRLNAHNAHENLQYVYDAIACLKKNLAGSVPIIGFAGAPWTIFCYMIEGKGSKTFSLAKKWLYQAPDLSHILLDKITEVTIQYLQEQVRAGADMLQIFDSWAEVLSPEAYRIFAIPYLDKIAKAFAGKTPITLFSKGAHGYRKYLAALPCDTIGLDWTVDIAESRAIIGANKTLQGNLDPCVLYSSEAEIVKQTEKMLADFAGQRHIANLGHGVYPDTDWQKVKLFIDVVKNYKFKNA